MNKNSVQIEVKGIDWEMLRRQKRSLVRILSLVRRHKAKMYSEHLEGLLNLIDHIQDEAARQIGERFVFGPRADTPNQLKHYGIRE